MTSTSQSLLVAAAVGLLSGTHTAIWGMYKDAIHEGFTVGRFVRSLIVGSVSAVAIQLWLKLPLPEAAALVMLFGLAYAAERGIVEVWKTFVRDEDQSKYAIPMQFNLLGTPVRSRGARLGAGAAYVAVLAVCLLAIARLDRSGAPLTALRAALLGLGVGTIIAIGGAWKDAPTEGFETLKFFRSPALTGLIAVLLSFLTESHLQTAVAVIGFERATTETYKTFFFPSKPRGKFAGKPVVDPSMLTRRQRFVPVYVAIWAAVIVASGVAYQDVAAREGATPASGIGAAP